jgi:hypothetical protein
LAWYGALLGCACLTMTQGLVGAMTAPLARRAPLQQGVIETAPKPQQPAAPRPLFSNHPEGTFPQFYQRALTVLLQAEDLYFVGQYQQCSDLLNGVWADYPLSSRAWRDSINPVAEVFLGTPPAYYALRMLSDCVNWRISTEVSKPSQLLESGSPVVLTVVLVGQSDGAQARNWEQLKLGKSPRQHHQLDPQILQQDAHVLHQSLRLFREYILAMTDGKLSVETRVLPLPELAVEVSTSADGLRLAGLAPGAMAEIWAAVPLEIQRQTDWWWVIYPSNVPEQYDDFKRTEFITGGMGTGPRAGSPCFIVDDRWLLRKPPHLGLGAYTEAERRAYLPQWLQHEFFHHLFRSYPEFELERSGHQWFDRSTWPDDFVGVFEADYYQEALHKRLRTQAKVPLHIQLRYAAPPAKLYQQIKASMLLGSYRHEPYQNKWHGGVILLARPSARSVRSDIEMVWKNQAGVSWPLHPKISLGVLQTGPGNPYFKNQELGPHFQIALQRNAAGKFVAQVAGFHFQGTFYKKVQP